MGRAHPVAVKASVPRTSVVKVAYVKSGNDAARHTTAHINYIQNRELGRGEPRRQFFDKNRDVLAREEAKLAMMENQNRNVAMYKLILSPGIDYMSKEEVQDYARNVMSQLEERLGQELTWSGVVHQNTEHPHAHVILAGRDADSKPVRLYILDVERCRTMGNKYLIENRYHDRDYQIALNRDYQKDLERVFNIGSDRDLDRKREAGINRDDHDDTKMPKFSWGKLSKNIEHLRLTEARYDLLNVHLEPDRDVVNLIGESHFKEYEPSHELSKEIDTGVRDFLKEMDVDKDRDDSLAKGLNLYETEYLSQEETDKLLHGVFEKQEKQMNWLLNHGPLFPGKATFDRDNKLAQIMRAVKDGKDRSSNTGAPGNVLDIGADLGKVDGLDQTNDNNDRDDRDDRLTGDGSIYD